MDKKIDWVCHYVSNNCACAECGKVKKAYPSYVCDAHTHGMDKYNHLEFQVILDYGLFEIGRLLNTMGKRVQNGESFKDGDWVKGLYEDCDVLLREIPDSAGEPVLRLIIPDRDNKMPEESTVPYSYQSIATPVLAMLKKKDE